MLRMLDRRIAVTPLNNPDISQGGIIIPDEAKERSNQGYIKYLGSNCDEFEVGDYVMFSGYTGTNIQVDGEAHVIVMHKDYILCKLEPPNTPVPGLYYRDKKGWDKCIEVLVDYVGGSESDREEITDILSKHQPYFQADSETSLSLIASAMKQTPFYRSSGIKEYRSRKDRSGF